MSRPFSTFIISCLMFVICSSMVHAQALGEFGCQFHANEYFSQGTTPDDSFTLNSYMALMKEAVDLETELIQLDITNDLWTEERAALLLEFAKARRSTGDNEEARSIYEDALLNMRVNRGVFSLDQIPVILDLMAWYMSIDPEFTDELGDRAVFLYEKNYQTDEEIPELVQGFSRLLKLRSQTHQTMGDQYADHHQKAAELGDKISDLLERLFNSGDPAVQAQLRGNVEYFTNYDDYGNPVSSHQPGAAQVSQSTGQVLEEVQSLLSSTSAEKQTNLDRAKTLLDGLNRNFAALSFVDRTALLDFYGDYYIAASDIPQAIAAFEGILNVRVLRPDYQLRALRTVGQLYEEQERWEQAVDAYSCWQQLSNREDARVSLGLANAFHEREEYGSAIRHLEQHIQLVEEQGSIAERITYIVLKNMYYKVNEMDAAEEVNRKIASLFN